MHKPLNVLLLIVIPILLFLAEMRYKHSTGIYQFKAIMGILGIYIFAHIQAGTDYLLYIADYSDEELDDITGVLNQNNINMHWTAKKIYQIETTNEALFQLQAGKE